MRQPAQVHGLLATIDGTPIPGALIEVGQQSSGWTAQPAGQITTEETIVSHTRCAPVRRAR